MKMASMLESAVPENAHTTPTDGISWGVRCPVRPRI